MSAPTIIADQQYDSELPPHDERAEQAILGAMMREVGGAEARRAVFALVQPEDFYLPRHQAIAQVIRDMDTAGEVIDPITVSGALPSDVVRRLPAGASYVHTLQSLSSANPMFAAGHAEKVQQCALRRAIVEDAMHRQQMAQNGTASAEKLIESLHSAADRLSRFATGPAEPSAADDLEALFGYIEDRQNGTADDVTPTGFVDLDRVLDGGIGHGHLVVVAGRAGAGKSTLMADISRNVAFQQGGRVLYVSQEMSRRDLHMRIMAAESRVRLSSLRSKGGMRDDDWTRLARRRAVLQDDDEHGSAPWKRLVIANDLTPSQIATRAATMQAEDGGLALVVVDYLQNTTPDQPNPNRVQEVSAISGSLQKLASRLGVPVVAGSQFNRAAADREPKLADLRESGSIEQDADLVLMISRPDQLDPDTTRVGEADVIIGKNRHGRADAVVTVSQQLHYSRFANAASEQVPPDPPKPNLHAV